MASGRLRGNEARDAARHIAACARCRTSSIRFEELDRHLRELARERAFEDLDSPAALPRSDPFHARPVAPALRARRRLRDATTTAAALSASANSDATQLALLEALHGSSRSVRAAVAAISPSSAEQRFGLLYALQAAGSRIAESPSDARRFALLVLKSIPRWKRGRRAAGALAETVVPREALEAQAHFLAAQADIWTRDLSAARRHQASSYRIFGRLGDEIGLALVELNEAQRRVFAGEPEAALELARRSRSTFETSGMDDLAARSSVAEGLALYSLQRAEESLPAFRGALPVFEREGLWSNYVAALNEIGSALLKLGRVDEARREYARALARFDRVKDRALLGYLRSGLAEILFAAGRFREAAQAAARASAQFADAGLVPSALTATLLEVESWARAGFVDRARERLSGLLEDFRKLRKPDKSLTRELAEALSGRNPDFERLARLRERAVELLAAPGA
jgi:tetratricopeptide (TPR) repeat protein